MKLSAKGLMALIAHEGIVQARYKDAVGVWTIGAGHTAAAGSPDPSKFNGTMTVREVFDLLRKDAATYEAAVSKAVKVSLEPHEFDALVSWHYNTGRIAKASFLADLNAGRKSAAGAKLRKAIVTAKGEVLQALVDRRKVEADMFLSGIYPKPFATLYPATPQGKVLWSQGKKVDLIRALQIAPPPKPDVVAAPISPSPAPPEPAAPSKGWLVGISAAVVVAFGGMVTAAQCALPRFIIDLFGYASRCVGGQ